MDFWNNKVGVSEEAARLQTKIHTAFSPEKKSRIASDFLAFGVQRTRQWIKEQNPYFSELEISLEFVRTQYYQTGEMPATTWQFYRETMLEKIRKDWTARFRRMMEEKNWTYDDIAKMGNFKNGKVIQATIGRGLPSFAKVAVIVHESARVVVHDPPAPATPPQ